MSLTWLARIPVDQLFFFFGDRILKREILLLYPVTCKYAKTTNDYENGKKEQSNIDDF